MKNHKPKPGSIGALERAALLAITVQLTTGSLGAFANNQQPLLNTTLPLPDMSSSQLEKIVHAGTSKAADHSVAVPKKAAAPQQVAASVPPPAMFITDAPPPAAKSTPTFAQVPNSAKPVATDEGAPSSSWLEDALTDKDHTQSAQQETVQASTAAGESAATTYSAAEPALLQTSTAAATEQAAPVLREAISPTGTQTQAPGKEAPTNTAVAIEPAQNQTVIAIAPASPAHTLASPEQVQKELIFIDNDEAIEQQACIRYEDLPTDATGTKVKVGAHFPVVIVSEITSKTAKVGDPIQGRLKYDLKIGDRLVAQKGAMVMGHVNYCLPARTPMRSLVSTQRWYRNSGCLGLTFDEIVNGKGEHIPLVAEPARQALYVKNKGEGRELGINHKGQIAGPWSKQLEYKAVRIGLNAAFSATGAFSFGAMPVALGVIGAINPSFAFMKPVGTNVRHRRIKGFFWGALSGVPGSWLIEDTTIKGQEAVVKPGDEFLAELRKEFTGEPESEAELSGASTKVHGEVVGRHGGKKKK